MEKSCPVLRFRRKAFCLTLYDRSNQAPRVPDLPFEQQHSYTLRRLTGIRDQTLRSRQPDLTPSLMGLDVSARRA